MPHKNDPGYDFAVGAFIVSNGRVLLVDHKKLGVWLPPGGHVEADENPVEALHREVMEEVGLRIEVVRPTPPQVDAGTRTLPPPDFLDDHFISKTHRHVGMFWVARPTGLDGIKFDANELNGLGWYSPPELINPVIRIWPSVARYAVQAIYLVS
jgi:8-oxo-dGTP pyrophosphatase MutT (NUDIX family)